MPRFKPVMLRRHLMREIEVLLCVSYGGQVDSNILHKQEGTKSLYLV